MKNYMLPAFTFVLASSTSIASQQDDYTYARAFLNSHDAAVSHLIDPYVRQVNEAVEGDDVNYALAANGLRDGQMMTMDARERAEEIDKKIQELKNDSSDLARAERRRLENEYDQCIAEIEAGNVMERLAMVNLYSTK